MRQQEEAPQTAGRLPGRTAENKLVAEPVYVDKEYPNAKHLDGAPGEQLRSDEGRESHGRQHYRLVGLRSHQERFQTTEQPPQKSKHQTQKQYY